MLILNDLYYKLHTEITELFHKAYLMIFDEYCFSNFVNPLNVLSV